MVLQNDGTIKSFNHHMVGIRISHVDQSQKPGIVSCYIGRAVFRASDSAIPGKPALCRYQWSYMRTTLWKVKVRAECALFGLSLPNKLIIFRTDYALEHQTKVGRGLLIIIGSARPW